MRNDEERLQDILEAIAQIEKYAIQGKEEFQNNELVQIWIIYHLQIIGEASNNLSPKLIAQYPQIPWAEIIAFRNILVHEYFRIDFQAVWKIINRDLTDLKIQVANILENEQ